MSAPAWLLDAIHATESASVPTVPNHESSPWVQGDRTKTHINTGVASDAPIVPTVPKKIYSTRKDFWIASKKTDSDSCVGNDDIDSQRFSIFRRSGSHLATLMKIERERRHAKVQALLNNRRYIVMVEDDKADPVIATVCIQGLSIFEMAIPHHSYNGIVLMELIEKYSKENYGNV